VTRPIHGEPVGRVDQGDHGDQRGDLVVVVVLAHLGPGLVGHAVLGVGEPGALLGERQRGPLGLGEHGGLAPGGDPVEPDRGFTGGRGLLGVDVGAPAAAVDLAGAQGHRLFEDMPPEHIELELTRAFDGPGVLHLRYRVRQAG